MQPVSFVYAHQHDWYEWCEPVTELKQLNGATRLYYIVGDPIAQVKSPAGVTEFLQTAGKNALCLPAHVSSADLSVWFRGVAATRNVDGIIVTVPHKFAMAAFCEVLSPRSEFLGAVNTLRRLPDGRWHGDMFDGLAMVAAIQKALGGQQSLHNKKSLLVGAGGAGSAIAHALIEQGLGFLQIADADEQRQSNLVGRLNSMRLGKVQAGGADPEGFDWVVNASPAGMQKEDALPIDAHRLSAQTVCACVITQPVVSPWLSIAQAKGCTVINGSDMFMQVRQLMLEDLLQ
jgi:shikimate dehydrogenase